MAAQGVRGAVGAVLLAAAAQQPAKAQSVFLSPTAALACMTPAPDQRGAPEYDPELVRAKVGGTVAVELTFTAAEAEPAVRMTSPFVSEDLERAVRRHVQQLRVPCLAPGQEPVRVLMEFVFVPNDGRKVVASAPRDAAEARGRELFACLTRIAGPATPNYPTDARRADFQGTVIAQMRFASPTAPPAVSRITSPRGDRWLWSEVESFAGGYRLPCLGAHETLTTSMVFQFRLDGAPRMVIKDLPLQSLVAAAASYARPVYFDLDGLGCPFDVRITYLQPHLLNAVQELGESRPERRPLLDWLRTIRLKLLATQEERVLGDSFLVRIPCGKVDL